jgi:GNAT superfamily N-acetyltransferase
MFIRQGGVALLAQYATIPIAFEVRSILQPELIDDGLGGILLHEVPVQPAYLKDYDEEESPIHWPQRFDMTNWTILLAMQNEQSVGGAAVACRTSGLDALDGRTDAAILWDLRVRPDQRGRGIGRQLIDAAATWARAQACRQLVIETQNVNVPACRFYRRCGCRLGEINRYAYVTVPKVAHEVMLLWYLDL